MAEMNKYSFTQYKKIDSILFRLDVYPFIILYTVQFSILVGRILNLSDRVTIIDIYNSIKYLINFLSNLNSSSDNESLNEDLIINDELQLIIDNVPIRYIISIFITFIINILIFLMTQWNMKFRCIICYEKIKKNNLKNDNINSQTTHIFVKSSKYQDELCPLKYSTCIEHMNKLKSMNNIIKMKSVNIIRINNSFIIQIDAIDFWKYRHELERLLRNENNNKIEWIKLVNYEKKIFVYDENQKTFIKAKYPVDLSLKSYFDHFLHKGGLKKNEILLYNNIYGINNYEIPGEKFFDLFIQQIISPFFLFQIFCVLLWILDEYWQMSLFTLFMLCTLEAQMVFRRIKESEELRNMRRPPCYIFVYRDNTWKYITTDHLLPGDIIAFSSNKDDENNKDDMEHKDDVTSISPCDFLLLSGNITVNEAMLTGECTPKMKVSMNIGDNDNINCQNLCIDKHKNHIIFAGTNVILTRSSFIQDDTFQSIIKRLSSEYKSNKSYLNQTDNQQNISYMKYNNDKMICIGYVLRTGFNTYQGKLIRTISSSSEKITSNSFEALIFLFLLIICSLVASAYILYNGFNDPARNKFKLILSCIHIITSVVPPEFPITLSVAVTMAVIQLTKKKIYCTEPFRIPFAGKLSICAFDKTGTLTSDKMNLHGLFGINLKNNDRDSSIIFNKNDINTEAIDIKDSEKDTNIPFLSSLVMGCCNGLSLNGKVLVGDPMEKLIKKTSCWRINQSENTYYSKLYNSRLCIIKRYPFSPEEQRMTIIAKLDVDNKISNNQKSKLVNYSSDLSVPKSSSYGIVLSKGSPEIMLNFFRDIDIDLYKEIVHQCTKQGYRILALGAKYCTDLKDIYENNRRDFFENNLIFCGFLALYCPIKKHSKSVIEQLNYSGHKSIMITGDNILTAFHVAKNVSITNKDDILILSIEDKINKSAYIWKQSNGTIHSNFQDNLDQIDHLSEEFCIGITGDIFQSIIEKYDNTILSKLLHNCKIYARMSPKNKQALIEFYNRMGNMTLMCGDGTNDVGALKHSHVGISLLSNEVNDKGDLQKKKISFFDIKKDIEQRIKKGESVSKSQIQKEILKELQNMDEIPKVKLGDASIASPFTHKGESPNSVIKLVRYGRATLTTVLLMYKLMGLNSIVSAFSMSVLAYDGVKFGDFQTTFESIIMSAMFFLVLRNKPSKKLVNQKPPSSIFNPFIFLSFVLQAIVHLLVIYFGWKLTFNYRAAGYSMNVDGPFEPSIVNTTMFYLYTASHLSCFLSNAQGYPFTTPLSSNKYLIYISAGVIIFLITTIFGLFPSINYLFSLELFENTNYKLSILVLVFIDISGTFVINHLLNNLHLSKYN